MPKAPSGQSSQPQPPSPFPSIPLFDDHQVGPRATEPERTPEHEEAEEDDAAEKSLWLSSSLIELLSYELPSKAHTRIYIFRGSTGSH
ncbi:hypothetical protein EYF80_020405 [Liparis tanakae]|uniref:Uncharacterized protein n=1 Tax=Liparis tanakae TaxID=230148 RepID=A0A4Z2HWL8_9TELE|nr:hypothetical protein EYF80_020405 [Liparis tanakae]